MSATIKASKDKESPGSKELREIKARVEIRKEKERARKAEEALEDEEDAQKKPKVKKTLGLGPQKQKDTSKIPEKTSKEGDPKKQRPLDLQQGKQAVRPKKKKVNSHVDTSKKSFRVQDDIQKTVVTKSQADEVSLSDEDASDSSEEGVHTSDSESVDSSRTSGSEEQTSLKKSRASNSNVMLLKSTDLLDKTSDVAKIEAF